MLRMLYISTAIFLFSSVAYAGSCDDCLTTFEEHIEACNGDPVCETRAEERLDQCLLGCPEEFRSLYIYLNPQKE